MTAYKRPVFFDRDIKSFSELSADSGLDLGIVARSILAEAALQVGSSGTAGTVSVKKADDTNGVDIQSDRVTAWFDQASDLRAWELESNGSRGQLRLYRSNDTSSAMLNEEGMQLFGSDGATIVQLQSATGRARFNNASGQTFVDIEPANGTATFGGPVAGTVSVKNASNAETIRLGDDGASNGLVTLSKSDGTVKGYWDYGSFSVIGADGNGIAVLNDQGVVRAGSLTGAPGQVSVRGTSAETVLLDGATATATIGGPVAGTVSVKNASDAQTINLAGSKGAIAHGTNVLPFFCGQNAFAGGLNTKAQGAQAFATGENTQAPGVAAHAEGYFTSAWGDYSHAEGGTSSAEGARSHAEGDGTAAVGEASHAGGLATVAWANYQTAIGKFNVLENADSLFVVGNGTEDSARSDAFRVDPALVKSFVPVEVAGSIILSGAASKITGLVLSEITGGTDAASKAYVDSIAQGLNIKGACHVSSQGNIEVLATTTEVDGHTLSEGERVLVRYQSDAIENGIYRFNGTGLERAADMAVGSHAAGAFTFVQFGTNADQGWVCTADAPADVVGTDALPWTQFSAAGVIEAGDGLQLIGTVMSAKLDGTTLSASASGLAVVGLPSLFEVNGIAVGEGVSAANLTTLTSGLGSDAKALHSHFGDRIVLPVGTIEGGKCAVINASGEADIAGTTASGAWVVGFCTGVAEGYTGAYITRSGLAENVLFSATPGDVYYVQADGTVGTALPTEGRVIMVGVAASASDLFVQIRDFGSILAA